jgi:type I restriction enzyme S subunit
MFETLWQRNVESRTVALVRDTLLPKLVSGELRVKDADKFIGRLV